MMKKNLITGILAHVDAGKTTLSESLLYTSGAIRKLGKVDTKNAFLDTGELERERGITIFSKQARFSWGNSAFTIVDTPGHVDFSAETERTLSILDYAILVISGTDGVQGHTQTLWELLELYDIPVFVFVNKMDLAETSRSRLMENLHRHLDVRCVDFTDPSAGNFYEDIASCDEEVMETYFETGTVTPQQIGSLIWKRRLFPCYFGSALKVQGISAFLDGMDLYMRAKHYPAEFGARVYKISRDEAGNRLTHMKITGGSLKVRAILTGKEERVTQIRLYSGEKYDTPQEVSAGMVCTVTGLSATYPGQGLGFESEADAPVLEPVLSRSILLPAGQDPGQVLPQLKLLEEEQPELHIVWDERLQEIEAQVMGEVQIEILQSLIASRFGVQVEFGPAHIVYKETIAAPVEGVGHFEPLRHYAEVHLLLEPLPRGSGLEFAADCSEELLARNWQRLILTHLAERTHRGVLTGAAITDLRITVVAGRAHPKHTEGGDFRQATYRAVRQGLMEAESVLLEPYYHFRLEVPQQMVGRAMTDIERMNGTFTLEESSGGMSLLSGCAPVVTMQDYKREVSSYTKGFGRLSFSLQGYGACHNPEEVIAAAGYDPEADPFRSPDSVFCSHGSGYLVPWYEVKDLMHVPSPFAEAAPEQAGGSMDSRLLARSASGRWLAVEEVDAILERAGSGNRGGRDPRRKGRLAGRRKPDAAPVTRTFRPKPHLAEYLLVDGYNVIYAWEETKKAAASDLAAARGMLLDELCNYQGLRKMELICVFDAYRVSGHPTEYYDYHNIHVVFTREAETADQYIEKFAHDNAKKYHVTVATSDGLEQVIIRGEGCALLSAQDLRAEIDHARQDMRREYTEKPVLTRHGQMEEAIRKALEESS